jgi:hypothetical protein
MGDEELSAQFSNERTALKQATCGNSKGGGGGAHNNNDEARPQSSEDTDATSLNLQHASMSCRLAARKLVLEQDRDGSKMTNLKFSLSHLSEEIQVAPKGSPIRAAAMEFRDAVIQWKDKPKGLRQGPLLEACDVLRDILRANGVQVNDSISSRRSRILLNALC